MPHARSSLHVPPCRPPFGLSDRSPETKAVDPLSTIGQAAEPWTSPAASRCRIVRQLTAEMVVLIAERVPLRRDRRRSSCHVRQISMYICHVVLQISLTEIGQSFGRDRTTVGHACNVVEDRRDDKAFDDFVASLERIVVAIFGAAGGREHE